MRWNEKDLQQYENSKEFIDTAIIPIFSFNPNELGSQVVREQKWLEEVCVYAERQLTGRAILFPTFYRFDFELNMEIPSFQAFTHALFITTNPDIAAKLNSLELDTYLLDRKKDEEELAVMVREGKKLAQVIMNKWKAS